MSRKDYIKIAKAVFNAPIDNDARTYVALELASTLSTDNPKFNRNKFMTACVVEPHGN